MYQRPLTRLLLLPSLLSGTIIFVIVAIILGYNAWLYIGQNQLFYDYLFGAYGLKTYVWQHSLQASAWNSAFLSSPVAYYILVGAVATVAGLIVYTMLQALSLVFSGGRLVWRELHAQALEQSRSVIARELVGKLTLRSIGLIGWAVYTAFFFSTLLPFVVVLNQVSIDHIHAGQQMGWLGSIGAVSILAITLHLQVVFVRLVFLRPRLFGGDQTIEEAEAEAHEHGIE